jgi:hypothetical protein
MIIVLAGLVILAAGLNLLMLVPGEEAPFTPAPQWADAPSITRHRAPAAPGRDWAVW